MSKQRISENSRRRDVPYNPKNRAATLRYWKSAIPHRGVAELRAKRGRPTLPPDERKEQIALRVDKEVLDWYRAQGSGWQTRMNAVLKAFRDVNETAGRKVTLPIGRAASIRKTSPGVGRPR
jgi:uncharacterized protein (DUF4415 family)